jgi:hypothetical protein
MAKEPQEGDTRIRKGKDFIYHEKFLDGMWHFHRDDGPAYIDSSGCEEYWLVDISYDKEEWIKRATKLGRILYG